MTIQQTCIEAYRKHRHLKLAGEEVGIPWQTLYVHLRNAGEPVTGDKLRYGSDKDKLAAHAEMLFAGLVPFARDMNADQFQHKVDFVVKGHGVDVKCSRPKRQNKAHTGSRFMFSIKKQQAVADFFVCFCLVDNKPARVLLIPGEIARNYQSISLPMSGGKWSDYEIAIDALLPFFRDLPTKDQPPRTATGDRHGD